jgi:hypothetical protein
MERSTGILWRVWDMAGTADIIRANSLDDAKRIFDATHEQPGVGFQPV